MPKTSFKTPLEPFRINKLDRSQGGFELGSSHPHFMARGNLANNYGLQDTPQRMIGTGSQKPLGALQLARVPRHSRSPLSRLVRHFDQNCSRFRRTSHFP